MGDQVLSTLNVAKTQMMLVSMKHRESDLYGISIMVGEHEIERKRCVKSLGVYLDDSLKWHEQVNAICRKCWAALASLKRFRKVLPVSLKKKLYNCMVLPHLDYCCLIW